jgi:glycosyltransferase involved in cell wall biosynthesis
VAVLLPCYNEESSISRVVEDFRAALPGAVVYVYDNASDDRTAELAAAAGAVVCREDRRGKGTVVCRMFADVDADVYVLADGDGTYDPADAPAMLDRLVRDNLDMIVGHRVPVGGDERTFPRGHVVGNWLFNRGLRTLFGGCFTDVFSGYRVLSRRFVKSFPVRFAGFEIETELVTHTVDIGLPYAEMPTTYRSRDVDSKRKLRTVRDGVRILVAALLLFKELRPLRFFTIIAATLTVLALGLGAIPVTEFLTTGLVLRLPTAVLAASIQIVAFISLTAGIILDSVCHGRRQAKRLVYLSLSPVRTGHGGAVVAQRTANGASVRRLGTARSPDISSSVRPDAAPPLPPRE